MNRCVFSVLTICLLLLVTGCSEIVVPQISPSTSPPVTTTAVPPPPVTITIPRPPPSTTTTSSHGYFPEQSQFVCRVTDAKGANYAGNQVNPGYMEIQGKYVSMDVRSDLLNWTRPQQLYAYQFETIDASTQVNLVIPRPF